jgi:hypothetical protein
MSNGFLRFRARWHKSEQRNRSFPVAQKVEHRSISSFDRATTSTSRGQNGYTGTILDAQTDLLPHLDDGWTSPGILSFGPRPAAGLVFLQQPSNAGIDAPVNMVKVQVVDLSGAPET